MLVPFPVKIVRTRLEHPASVAGFYGVLGAICIYPQISGPAFLVYVTIQFSVALHTGYSYIKRRVELRGST